MLYIRQGELAVDYAHPFRSLGPSFYHVFLMSLGEMGDETVWGSEKDALPFGGTSFGRRSLAVMLFVIFMVLCGILAINLLIAMMSDTYTKITEKAKVAYVFPFARTILMLEKLGYECLPTSWPVQQPFRASVCAARALNAAGQSRVTLSLL